MILQILFKLAKDLLGGICSRIQIDMIALHFFNVVKQKSVNISMQFMSCFKSYFSSFQKILFSGLLSFRRKEVAYSKVAFTGKVSDQLG